ncbi:MAG: HNH endonuclease signature motif containing protein [archaeon]
MDKEVEIDANGYLREEGDLVSRKVAYERIYKLNQERYDTPFSQYVVHHIDGEQLNNSVKNLYICTKKDHNSIHKEQKWRQKRFNNSSEIDRFLKSRRSEGQLTLPQAEEVERQKAIELYRVMKLQEIEENRRASRGEEEREIRPKRRKLRIKKKESEEEKETTQKAHTSINDRIIDRWLSEREKEKIKEEVITQAEGKTNYSKYGRPPTPEEYKEILEQAKQSAREQAIMDFGGTEKRNWIILGIVILFVEGFILNSWLSNQDISPKWQFWSVFIMAITMLLSLLAYGNLRDCFNESKIKTLFRQVTLFCVFEIIVLLLFLNNHIAFSTEQQLGIFWILLTTIIFDVVAYRRWKELQ